jgi:hypothetical protein
MALTKSYTAIQASTSNAAGATTDSSAATINYGLSIIAKVTNGATAPTVGCDVVLQVREAAGTWREYDRRTAGTGSNGVYSFVFNLGVGGAGGDWYEARIEFTGNTVQAVTVQADAESTTAL